MAFRTASACRITATPMPVVRDAQTVGAVAVDLERLIGEHAARINGVHVRDQQDFLRAPYR
jgi:hypothetical protein